MVVVLFLLVLASMFACLTRGCNPADCEVICWWPSCFTSKDPPSIDQDQITLKLKNDYKTIAKY